MGRLSRLAGLARSAGMYYGIPFRRRRLERFYARLIGADALCFDIGAHLGNRIRAWRALGARVVAVEPQPELFRILERLYGNDADVTLVRCALGRAPGRATLFVSERYPTVASVSEEWIARVKTAPRFAAVEWGRGEPVDLRTLDALIAAHGLPDFVKIDVEGYEAEVLAGLSTPVRALSFECLPATRDIALACIDRLSALGVYHYNYSPGESHRLTFADWLDARGIARYLTELPAHGNSGDVYARLDGGGPPAAGP